MVFSQPGESLENYAAYQEAASEDPKKDTLYRKQLEEAMKHSSKD